MRRSSAARKSYASWRRKRRTFHQLSEIDLPARVHIIQIIVLFHRALLSVLMIRDLDHDGLHLVLIVLREPRIPEFLEFLGELIWDDDLAGLAASFFLFRLNGILLDIYYCCCCCDAHHGGSWKEDGYCTVLGLLRDTRCDRSTHCERTP